MQGVALGHHAIGQRPDPQHGRVVGLALSQPAGLLHDLLGEPLELGLQRLLGCPVWLVPGELSAHLLEGHGVFEVTQRLGYFLYLGQLQHQLRLGDLDAELLEQLLFHVGVGNGSARIEHRPGLDDGRIDLEQVDPRWQQAVLPGVLVGRVQIHVQGTHLGLSRPDLGHDVPDGVVGLLGGGDPAQSLQVP